MTEAKNTVLLYYHYTPIEDPEAFREEHHLFCLNLGLRGRIIVAKEGLNGTVSGTKEACQQYMNAVKAKPGFESIDFKVDEHEKHAFQKMHVRLKTEIVHSGLEHLKPHEQTGTHLSPAEFRAMKDGDDVVVLDVRSNYEHQLGRFKNAVTLDIDNFREFPDQIGKLEQYKGKKVLTYCTGGIKCEKASAFLLEQGFENVYQLHGGIIKYGIEAGGEDFDGKCYVFDNRLTVDVNSVNPTVISQCRICGKPSDRMVNCANSRCNDHFVLCEDCGWEMEGACSEECKHSEHKREYDGTGYYTRKTNHYNPYLNAVRKPKEAPAS